MSSQNSCGYFSFLFGKLKMKCSNTNLDVNYHSINKGLGHSVQPHHRPLLSTNQEFYDTTKQNHNDKNMQIRWWEVERDNIPPSFPWRVWGWFPQHKCLSFCFPHCPEAGTHNYKQYVNCYSACIYLKRMTLFEIFEELTTLHSSWTSCCMKLSSVSHLHMEKIHKQQELVAIQTNQ